jgi:type IV pilus assembly protein PilC
VANWYLIFGGLALFGYTVKESFKRSVALQQALDRVKLKLPVFGDLIQKSIVARWTRTLATLFAAGVPLVDALESVGGTAGNSVYTIATAKIQREVSTGTGLTTAMTASGIFPNMVLQMCSIGEESGALDDMLNKAAEFFEEEVDEMVKGLSSLMEPIIIVFLGTIIGGIVVAMYLPIFKMGGAV